MHDVTGSVVIFSLILVVIAGFINGSFATPTKYMKKWNEENIWFSFAFYGFLVLPWISIFVMAPDVLGILGNTSKAAIWTLVIGGVCFGLGQICFALAFKMIGLGINFVVNISLGTAVTALVALVKYNFLIETAYGVLQIIGIICFVVAILFCASAGTERDKHKKMQAKQNKKDDKEGEKHSTGYVIVGVILAICAGVGSACQGASYVLANPAVVESAKAYSTTGVNAATIAWVLVFTIAGIPYLLYFFFLSIKNGSFSKLGDKGTGIYWFYLLLMGIGFWGSLIFFSGASSMIGGALAPTIAWPLFMVFIILTSNFWGWFAGEWKGAGAKAGKKITFSLLLFIAAIIVFSCSILVKPDITEHKKVVPRHHATIELDSK
jgi:L-rhamnose-H+ transport protein